MFFGVVATLILFCPTASASDESYQKILQGFAKLQQGDDAAALTLFEAATAVDPNDAQAWLFTGTALDQLGQSEQALAALQKAKNVGCDDPELLFQMGRAQLGTGDAPAAIDSFSKFESLRPGRGQTSEFLGRAYLATGELTKADAAFQEALRRDPNLRSTVLPYQAELARRRNDHQAAWQTLDDLRWYAPDSATAHVLGEELGPRGWAAPDDNPLKFSISVGAGYSTDVRGIEVIAVQGNTNSRSSIFDETAVTGSYTWSHLTPTAAGQQPDQFTVGGSLLLDDYPRATQGDYISSLGSVEYRRPLFGEFSGSLQLSGGYDALSYMGFRDRIAGRAVVQWAANDRFLLEAAYAGEGDDYLYSPAPVQNPDAITHTFSLDGYLRLSKPDVPADRTVSLRVGGFYTLNYSKGADFDYRGGGIIAGLELPVINHIRAQLLYTWSDDRYLNLNSLTIDPNDILELPTYRRDDYVNSISLRLTRQMREWDRHLTVFAGYDYSNDSSNIPAYKFSQQVVSLGLSWDM